MVMKMPYLSSAEASVLLPTPHHTFYMLVTYRTEGAAGATVGAPVSFDNGDGANVDARATTNTLVVYGGVMVSMLDHSARVVRLPSFATNQATCLSSNQPP
jgi:hypothetical protein